MKHVGKSESMKRIPCVLMADLMTNRWTKSIWGSGKLDLLTMVWIWIFLNCLRTRSNVKLSINFISAKFKFKRTIVAKHSQLLTKYLTEVVLWMSNMLSKGSMQITQWSIKSNIQYIVWLVWPFIDVTVQLNCI